MAPLIIMAAFCTLVGLVYAIMMMMLMGGHLSSAPDMRRFIEGFN